MLMLLFHLGNSQYAVPAREVFEVVPYLQLESIAKAPPWVSGLMNYRGEHVPVIDLCHLIYQRHCKNTFTTRVILVEFPLARGGTTKLGLLAERVTETVSIDETDFSSTGVKTVDAPFLGEAVQAARGLVQRVSVADLLPETVQSQLFPAQAG